MDFDAIIGKSDQLVNMAMEYAPKLLLAIVTLLVGLWIIKIICKGIGRLMESRNVDATLRPFFMSMLTILLKVMLFITVVGMVGVEMTSFIAILAAAGLAVGMALSGTLQNFAGGVMILIFKPFKVGDVLEAQGYLGVVQEIQLFNTILLSLDNKTIIIPNGGLSTGSMVNYSTQPTRRVDMTFGIGYTDDIDKAKGILDGLLANHESVLKDPAHFIAVSELADSSVNFTVRAWVNAADYWTVFFFMQETVKKEFDKNNIGIPFPQRDVHVYNH
ncbi:mechanosensitive ion channel [Labilibaculum sp. DW002]|jgi:small conductance mechanosensitive channel|uniref:Mechanosensitive ion channel n=1 Tax=Paralabilibaculum antarcticum TaxID=2912572 RepID=A0ABT5VXV4_9BACT|nr:mechanosensitive ion channel domain-containing protein [Labilibaculum sp. DW002]MDE5420244.1 mechanosensitive ion channel [Labilibaculum sp. DW002]